METLLDANIMEHIQQNVQEHFTNFDDLAHGWEHVHRVYMLALHIAANEDAHPYIAGTAALLHDIGRTVPLEGQEGTKHHADLSVKIASELLQRYNVHHEEQQAVLHAIVAHSFSRNIEPETLEARVVRDADRLDSLGAIGILRWAITGTVRCTPETRTYHPEDPFAEYHELNDKKYMLDHFYTKLLKLSDTVTTETGRKMARQRVALMQIYLEEFKRELAV